MSEHAETSPILLTRSASSGVAVITLNRSHNRNALSLALLQALQTALAAIAEDRTIGAIVLKAEGPVFCSGHDLKEMTRHSASEDEGAAFYAHTFALCAEVMLAITALPQPVIAAVEGIATAAGCQLVATCDLAVAGAAAQFCTPGVNLGLFCTMPMVALARNVAPKHALEMLLLGEMADAQTAFRFGLVNKVVAIGTASSAAMALATAIASKSHAVVAQGKRAFYAQQSMPRAAAYDAASQIMACDMLERDAREGIGAFLRRVPPNWDNARG